MRRTSCSVLCVVATVATPEWRFNEIVPCIAGKARDTPARAGPARIGDGVAVICISSGLIPKHSLSAAKAGMSDVRR